MHQVYRREITLNKAGKNYLEFIEAKWLALLTKYAPSLTQAQVR